MTDRATDAGAPPAPSADATVHLMAHPIARSGSDAELLARVRAGAPGIGAALYDRLGADVNRVVWRFLGADPDHDDLVQVVFVKILEGVGRVRDPDALQSWAVSVAVNTVRSELRRRTLRRWLVPGRWGTRPPDVAADVMDPEARSSLRRIYGLLDELGADERIAFVLRYMEERPLAEAAELCGCSLATFKRRLRRASDRFRRAAQSDPTLAERLRRGTRWSDDDDG